MEVLLANPRGFCAGVDRAIEIVNRAIETLGAPIYVRHEVVHNRFVVEDLRQRGAVFVEELDEVPAGATVIFSAHGVSQAVRAEADRRGLKVFDATCPLVTKVHIEVARHCRAGRDVVLIGHAGHPEVEGTMGQWRREHGDNRIHLVEDVAGVATLQPTQPDNLAYTTQTTLSVDDTKEIIAALQARFPAIQGPKHDDICYATQNRQLAVKEIARDSDLVIVVGSGNSSNSVRLVEVALEAGARAAHRVDDASEIDEAWLDGVRTVSVTSGASVPEALVQGVLSFLSERGYPDARAVHSAEESLIFALPHELRRDLKAAGRS
ncbi:4-hydroxy-3-methylbut-2-enyl diphosphate reductase [Arenimonas sp.]|uniref:4-hydroxy-3-methylbut-2-enyl diphosphate reductase n=1 Tax=Arenimonas sp. TaxID=1872635 RepID=UPI0025E06C3A|nr:4-hydroxy-3-methylbut-2-enyl diphosphate reductase [Arenimonas sp.]